MSSEAELCPEKETLAEYLLGKLVEPELGLTESHVSRCGKCEDTLRGLGTNDTLSVLAEDFFRKENRLSNEDNRLLSVVIRQLKHNDHTENATQIQLKNRAIEVTRLLRPANSGEFIGSLGQYDVIELIGAGSTGVVYKAVDRQLDRNVAIKVLRPSLGNEARQRFLVEARAAAAINHPNVVSIHHVVSDVDLAYIVMQWISGRTLEQELGDVTFLPEQDVRKIASQIGSGLAAAHSRNLIHRDIKPANIWISDESGDAIILDFGLARIADDDPHMTATGFLAGTPNFMSPEQTRGLELDGRSDLFSLGCLLYRAVTGRLPFGANGVLATLQTIQRDTPRQPFELNPAITADFSDLIMCLLEKQAANRPANSAQFVSALSLPRSSWPFAVVPANTSPARQSSSRGKTRRKTYWLAASIVGLVLAVAGMIYQEDIVRIATNQGELVVQSNDEDVEIEIRQNGKLVRLIDLQTEQSIDIVAGEYDINVTHPDNGFKVSHDRVVMTRGRKEIVRIIQINDSGHEQHSSDALAARQSTASNGATGDLGNSSDGHSQRTELAPVNASTGESVYEGRTYSQWLEQLRAEKSPKAMINAMLALNTLSIGDRELQVALLEEVRPLIREHGVSDIVRYAPDIDATRFNFKALNHGFSTIFEALGPDLQYEFLIEEIKNGTIPSLLFCKRQCFGHPVDELTKSEFRDLVNALLVRMAGASSEEYVSLTAILTTCFQISSDSRWDGPDYRVHHYSIPDERARPVPPNLDYLEARPVLAGQLIEHLRTGSDGQQAAVGLLLA
ncbi:MAG: serine/threonine-protein kinase, partial [Planctomycetota bacterium]